MVVLGDADAADVAVVSATGNVVAALEAHLLQTLLAALTQQLLVVSLFACTRSPEQTQVEHEHGRKEDYF